MFDMFKKKPVPSGPITFDFDLLVERPPADVYALVDWADPRNAKRQLGHSVTGQSPHFELGMKALANRQIKLQVIEETPGEAYAFTCDIQPRVGRLVASTERYTFEDAGDRKCLLRLVNEATFIEGMSHREFEQEMMMMSVATNDAIMKLKVLAELGLEAAKSVEHATFS
jgi:hypothetical protein